MDNNNNGRGVHRIGDETMQLLDVEVVVVVVVVVVVAVVGV